MGAAAGSDRTPKAPVRVYIIHHYWVPDVSSTGQLLQDLGAELARRGFEVHALAARPSYGKAGASRENAPPYELRDGVHVRRVWTTRLPKDRMWGRALNVATFMAQLSVRMLFAPRDAVYLYVMNPPFVGGIGAVVSLFRRHRYILDLQDAYPHVATWVGKVRKGGLIERLWHRFNRFQYKRAERTIVICQASKRLVGEYGIDPERIHIVSNWADGDVLRPMPKRDSEFARQHGLVEPFTALYSGNLGLYYEFETLLAAAELLKDENFRLVFVGAGGRKQWIADQIKERRLTNTILLPYQPYEKLRDSLSACDASFVTIAKGIEGVCFPSKLYAALAIGRPLIAISENPSELRELVVEHDLGRWFGVGDPAALADGIRAMMKEPARLEQQGANARRIFEQFYTKEASCEQYARVLRMPRPR